MNYIHLTIEERACIAKFKEMNMNLREMAKILDRNVSTISRELKRNSYKTSIKHSVMRYSPTQAQKKYSNSIILTLLFFFRLWSSLKFTKYRRHFLKTLFLVFSLQFCNIL